MAERTLSHYAAFRFAEAFWQLAPTARRRALSSLLTDLTDTADRVALYQRYPAGDDADLVVWSALDGDDPAAADGFFRRTGAAVARHRPLLVPGATLWGLTRPSPYVREASKSALDPLAAERLPYLIVYPFVKTHAWYRLELDERRRLMGEHIRVGRRYDGVRQLLLYAFGLQDQDFVVVYDTADLALFSELVGELRATEARAYTARDTPVWTAVHRRVDELLELWAPEA
ncbi:MAG TPA: chlorite dismutase family protein [Thermoanaerobaculia bacterium]|nr:chlorite dismutase family protein [Thermoanaerobaculia bacterium]